MNRREAITSTFAATIAAAALRIDVFTKQASPAGNTLYVNPAGADTNPGARDAPLRTLAGAARRANASTGTGPLTIVLSEGIHVIGETTLLKPARRSFSRTDRLTIRADVLPDDPAWNTGSMPTLIHTLPFATSWNGRPEEGAVDGMLIETSHVTLQGLRFLGVPVVETPKAGLIQRLYGVSRLQRDLEDLEISQCAFLGDEVTNPSHVAVIANGNGVNVHHCLFRGVKITVVYWTPGSTGSAMTNCVIHDVYGSGIWTAGIAADFNFRNNVVADCNYAWTYQGGASALADATGGGRQGGRENAAPPAGREGAPARGGRGGRGGAPTELISYNVVNSYFANNRRLTGSGTGARLGYQDMPSTFLKMADTTVVDQPIEFERDGTKREYLHPIAGSAAARTGAGLFTK